MGSRRKIQKKEKSEPVKEYPEWVKNTTTCSFGSIYRLVRDGDNFDVFFVMDDGYGDHRHYEKKVIDNHLRQGIWIPCDPPSDDRLPLYGLKKEEKNKPEWVTTETGVSVRIRWNERFRLSTEELILTESRDGFYGSHSADAIQSKLADRMWLAAEKPSDAVPPAYKLAEEKASAMNSTDSDVRNSIDCLKVELFLEKKLTLTLRRKHEQALALIEELLKKYDPEMLAAVLEKHK